MRESTVHQFPAKPGEKGASEFVFGQPMLEFLERRKTEKANFDRYFEIRKYGLKEAWHEIYPIGPQIETLSRSEDRTNKALIVDVGGSRGQDLMSLAESYPKVRLAGRLIVQDLPSTIEDLPPLSHGVEAMSYDFFTPQPVHGRLIRPYHISQNANV